MALVDFTNGIRAIGVTLAFAVGAVMVPGSGIAAAQPRDALAAAIDQAGDRMLAFAFGPDNPIAMVSMDGSEYRMATDSRLVVVPSASNSALVSSLLVDRSIGDAARCEQTAAAIAGGLRQTSETYGPVKAWQRLGSPAVMINTNFFDVRPQAEGTSWGTSGCSTPMGTYYDTHLATRSLNFLRFWDRFVVGASGLSDAAGEVWSPLSTFFINDGALFGDPGPATFEMRDAASAIDNGPAKRRLTELELAGRQFTAFAGVKLRGGGDFQFVDDPVRRAARTAIGYSSSRDELYLFQGGSNEGSGFTLGNIQDMFRSLGADMAIALDGGGSSAMVIDKNVDMLWAGQGIVAGIPPAGSCADVPGAYCSPGADRPVPGWLGVR